MDSINRQDAIDALDGTVTVTGRTNAEAVRGYVNLVQDRIKRLPSAGQIMTATSNTVVSDTVKMPVMDGTTERLPSAERIGSWILHKNVGEFSGIVYRKYHCCSVCGERAIEDGDWYEVLSNYCPNCGARMVSE